jgi:hypothetical protein
MRALKISLTGLAATLVLLFSIEPASALRALEFSRREISLLARIWTISSTNLPGRVICLVALNVTLNEFEIRKGFETAIGRVEPRILSCIENTATILRGPYTLNYQGFTGSLPNITGLRLKILRMGFLIDMGILARCLIRTDAEEFQNVRERTLQSYIGFRLSNVTVTRLSGFCPTSGEVEMHAAFEPVNLVLVELI